MNEKIDQWIKEIKLLSEIAKIEPQCALSRFVSRYKHKLNYYMRTVPDISNLIQHIDDIHYYKRVYSGDNRRCKMFRKCKKVVITSAEVCLKRLTLNTQIQKW